MTDVAKSRTVSVTNLLEYLEPKIAAILDNTGAKIHILRAELFSDIESFLNHLDIGYGDKTIVVTSVHDASSVPAITRTIMAKGAIVRTFISYKLPASMFVLGIVKRVSF